MDADLVESILSTNLPYNILIRHNISRPSESQSEISSVDSDWSDIKSIAEQLNVANPDDLVTQRFKIDRQKLEKMIETDTTEGGINGAEQFFNSTMKTTSTFISWPCRLKIGAKTKKDPHVRIIGKPDDVSKAKECILESLDSRGTRVIMKIDISYTDHSYIIGRGGSNIKRIMEDTLTHIHFPDSNRSNPIEKSNQVSLCGTLEGVEKARALVRSSTPLIISFELPIMAPGRPVPDNDTQYIKDVQSKFNIQVIFSTRPKLHSSLILIKGSEKEASKVQEATQLLINFMCESIADQIHVNLQLEISPQHHEIVKGKNHIQLLSIMERTKTKIIFPDVKDVNIKPIKRSQVTITGTIDGVYKAKQQLIGNLPVALIFDYPDNAVDTSDITNLSNKYSVFISVRQKSRQSVMCVVIKGVEKCVDKIYEARHELLNLTTPLVNAVIPETYFAPKADEMSYCKSLAMLFSNNSDSPMAPSMVLGNQFLSQFGNFHKYSGTTHKFQQSGNLGNYCSQNNNNFIESQYRNANSNVSPRNTSTNTSGYHSFSSSTNSLEQLFPPYNPVPSVSQLIVKQCSPDNSGYIETENNRGLNDSSNSLSYENDYGTQNYDQTIFNYDPKKIDGYKAMERAPQGEVRTPNSQWAGLGLSKTSPYALETVNSTSQWNKNEYYPYNLGATTSALDTVTSNQRMQLTKHKDIHSLMTHLGLDHYISTFIVNEIDIELFASLTAENLTELGITAFGPRKKLLMAISTLNAANMSSSPPSAKFSGSAAPGAERRSWQTRNVD